jgi:hypothetical protein
MRLKGYSLSPNLPQKKKAAHPLGGGLSFLESLVKEDIDYRFVYIIIQGTERTVLNSENGLLMSYTKTNVAKPNKKT